MLLFGRANSHTTGVIHGSVVLGGCHPAALEGPRGIPGPNPVTSLHGVYHRVLQRQAELGAAGQQCLPYLRTYSEPMMQLYGIKATTPHTYCMVFTPSNTGTAGHQRLPYRCRRYRPQTHLHRHHRLRRKVKKRRDSMVSTPSFDSMVGSARHALVA